MGLYDRLIKIQESSVDSYQQVGDDDDDKKKLESIKKQEPKKSVSLLQRLEAIQQEGVSDYDSQPYSGQYDLGYGPSLNKTTNTGTLPEGSDIEDVKAMRQSAWDKAGNALVKFGGKIGTSAIETIGDVLYGIPKAIVEGKISSVWDNEIGQAMDDANAKLDNDLFPLYKEKGEGAFTGIIPGTKGSWNFWGDKVLGNSAQFIGPGLAAKALTYPLKYFKTALKLSKAANAEELFNLASKASDPIAELGKLGKAAVYSSGRDRLFGASVAALQEAGVSSRGVKEQVRNELINKKQAEIAASGTQRDLTEQELADIEESADLAGNTNFAMQMPIIAGGNLIAFGKLALGRRYLEKTPSILKNIGRNAEGVFERKVPSRLSKALGYARNLEAPASEFLQETSQYGIEQGASDFFSKKYDKDGENSLKDISESAAYGFQQAYGTPEGLEQGVIGALMGGGIEGIGAIRNRTGRNDIDTVVGVLNSQKTSDAVKPLYEHAVRDQVLQREKDAAIQKGDAFLYENADFDQFKSFVKSRIDSGKLETIYEDLDDISKLSEDEFKQAFGITPEAPLSKSPSDFANDVKKKVSEIDSLYGDINSLYGGLRPELREYLFDAASNISNVEERELSIGKQIKDITGVDYESIRRMNPENYMDVYIDELKKAGTKNPLNQDKVDMLFSDMDRLAQRREKFIDVYNKLKTKEGQEEILNKIASEETERREKASPVAEKTEPIIPVSGTVVQDETGNILAKNVNVLSDNEDGTVTVEGVTNEGNRYSDTVPKSMVTEITTTAPVLNQEAGIGNIPLESVPTQETSPPVAPYFFKEENGEQVRYEQGEPVSFTEAGEAKQGTISNIGPDGTLSIKLNTPDATGKEYTFASQNSVFKSVPSPEMGTEQQIAKATAPMETEAASPIANSEIPQQFSDATAGQRNFTGLVDFYNKSEIKRPDLKKRIKELAKNLNYKIKESGGLLTVEGLSTRRRSSKVDLSPVDNFVPISQRGPETQGNANALLSLAQRMRDRGKDIFIGAPGFGVNPSNIRGVSQDIATDKNTARAQKFMDYVDKVTEQGFVENQNGEKIPFDEYLRSVSEDNYEKTISEGIPIEESALQQDISDLPDDSVLKEFEVAYKDLGTEDYYAMQEEAEPLFVDEAVGRMVASLQNFYPEIKINTDPEVFSKTLEEAVGQRSDQVTQELSDPLGFVYNDEVFINPRKANTTTPIHEFGHVWVKFAGMNDPELLDRGLKLVEGTAYLEKAKRLYPDLSEEGVKEEALAMAIGDKGAEFFKNGQRQDEAIGNKFLKWLNDLFQKVKEFFGIAEWIDPQEVRDAELERFSGSISREILTGQANFESKRKANYDAYNEEVSEVLKAGPEIKFQRGDLSPQEFEKMAAEARNHKGKNLGKQYQESVGKTLKSTGSIISNAIEPVDSAAYRINKKVGAMMKQLSFREGENIKNWQSAIISTDNASQKSKTFHPSDKLLDSFKRLKKINKADYWEMTFRLNNGDLTGAQNIIAKYNPEAGAQFEGLKNLLEEIYMKAKDAGIDMGYVFSYFPTAVKDYDGLMKHLGKEGNSGILAAIEEAQRKEQLKEEYKQKPLTKEHKAEIVSKLLRGYKVNGITLAKVGSQKSRTVDFITPEMLQFYHEPSDAVLAYIHTMASSIATRNLFGKGATIDDSIAKLMLDLRENGEITDEDESKLTEILKARFSDNRMDLAFRNFRSATYLGLLGNIGSAITQIADLTFSFTKNGLGSTLNSYQKAWLNNSKITATDVHASQIADELKDPGKLGNIINTVFKFTGLSKMDRLGKETFINSSLERYQKLANTNESKLREEIKDYFVKESDVENTIKDFKDGTISENVRYVIHADLSGIQPITKGAHPKYYHLMNNGKIFYALKSFALVQLDYMRRKFLDRLITGIKNKDRNMILGTIRDFTRFAAVFVALGMGADELKRLLYLSKQRKLTLSDRVIENMIKLGGISRYTIYTAQKEGPGEALLQELTPATPVGFVDDLWNVTDKPGRFFGKLPIIGRPVQYFFLEK